MVGVGQSTIQLSGWGWFLELCYKMNLRYQVPSRPYLQCHFLDTAYAASTKMLSVYLMYLDSAVWISSDTWKSRYGKFSLISLTIHFLDEDWIYQALSIGARNFKGRHINEQV